MNESTTRRIYDLWAKGYDGSFGRLLGRGQLRAVEQLRLRPHDRVLDIGVGTGIMLSRFPQDVFVVGLDLSAGMLKKARQHCAEQRLDHCHLIHGDAMLPPFAAGSFDHVIVSHTISVVSDPARLLRLAAKLLKPGGRIVVLNHFLSEKPPIAWLEKAFNPLFMKLGWRSDLSLESVVADCSLRVDYRFKPRWIDVWQIVVLTDPAQSRAQQPPGPPPVPEAPQATVSDRALPKTGMWRVGTGM